LSPFMFCSLFSFSNLLISCILQYCPLCLSPPHLCLQFSPPTSSPFPPPPASIFPLFPGFAHNTTFSCTQAPCLLTQQLALAWYYMLHNNSD
jgi:hypothetical protein